MKTSVNADAVARALARDLATAWSSATGATATLAAGENPLGMGWTVAVPITGAAAGQLVVWFDADAATAGARKVLASETDPADDAIAHVLGDVVSQAAETTAAAPEGAGLVPGAPASRKAIAPQSAQPFLLTAPDGSTCRVAVLAELSSSAAGSGLGAIESGDSRLEAVLEVDLPLVVRFGRAVMPLRAVAELSPGAVVDMGRSPDEPVELLVGERLIARGEVVIVGGNYGVRITELTSGRRSTDLEAR